MYVYLLCIFYVIPAFALPHSKYMCVYMYVIPYYIYLYNDYFITYIYIYVTFPICRSILKFDTMILRLNIQLAS